MRTYNIYLDRIGLIDDFRPTYSYTFEEILISLSRDLYTHYLSLGVGQGITYRRLSFIIYDIVNLIDFNNPSHVISTVNILRNTLCSLRRFKFFDFQINLLNHV